MFNGLNLNEFKLIALKNMISFISLPVEALERMWQRTRQEGIIRTGTSHAYQISANWYATIRSENLVKELKSRIKSMEKAGKRRVMEVWKN